MPFSRREEGWELGEEKESKSKREREKAKVKEKVLLLKAMSQKKTPPTSKWWMGKGCLKVRHLLADE